MLLEGMSVMGGGVVNEDGGIICPTHPRMQPHTTQISRIQQPRRHIPKPMVLSLPVQNLKHTSRRIDSQDRNARETFLDLDGYGADATGIIEYCGRGFWGHCFSRLKDRTKSAGSEDVVQQEEGGGG